jgi:hypothetical protein
MSGEFLGYPDAASAVVELDEEGREIGIVEGE